MPNVGYGFHSNRLLRGSLARCRWLICYTAAGVLPATEYYLFKDYFSGHFWIFLARYLWQGDKLMLRARMMQGRKTKAG
jgi:hypothetical protein